MVNYISPYVLEFLYIRKKMTMKQIAQKLGVSFHTVSNRIKRYGLKRHMFELRYQ